MKAYRAGLLAGLVAGLAMLGAEDVRAFAWPKESDWQGAGYFLRSPQAAEPCSVFLTNKILVNKNAIDPQSSLARDHGLHLEIHLFFQVQ